MQYRNRLPAEFRTALAPKNTDDPRGLEAAAVRELLADGHTRDAAAALLRLLTRLANCGLDAGAPPLLQSVHHKG